MEIKKEFTPPLQSEAGYVTLSAAPGQACANCRWFKAVEYEDGEAEVKSECHLIANWPEAILATGRCDRWEAAPSSEPAPLEVVVVDASAQPAMQGEAAAGGKGLIDRIRDLFPKRKAADDLNVGLKVVGNHWLIVWSNNFEDRDGECFTQKAIDKYVARVDVGAVPLPELWIYHTPGTRIGQASWVGRHDHFVLAGGDFDSTPQAQAAKAFYQRTAGKTSISHGFTFPPDALRDKAYHEFNTFEITLLPRGAEANRFTSLEGVKAMALEEHKRAHIIEAFGKELAEEILGDLDKRGKALEEVGIAFKDYVDATDGKPSAAKEAVEAVEASLKTLIADLIGDSAETASQHAAEAKAFTALTEQVQGLRAEVAALKELVDLKPRSASTDSATTITNAALSEDVKKQFSKIDDFFGTQVNSAP